MLLSYVWIIMVILSIFCSILTGRTAQTGSAALIGAQNGVTLALSLCGSLCLWSGFAKLTEKSGLARRFSALLRPLLSRLFPEASRDPSALQDLCGNLTANFLGLGNAATPMGISAVRRMHALPEAGRKRRDVPSDRAEHCLHSTHSFHCRCRPRFAWVGPPV